MAGEEDGSRAARRPGDFGTNAGCRLAIFTERDHVGRAAARLILRDPDQAKDAVQETLVRACAVIAPGTPENEFRNGPSLPARILIVDSDGSGSSLLDSGSLFSVDQPS